MDFHNFTTLRDATKRSGVNETADEFYRSAYAAAVAQGSGQFYGQLHMEREWERQRRPYYAVWPSIVPMLTRLNLDLDSSLIHLPLPALCIRFPKQNNPLTFDWKGKETAILCMLMGEINEGRGLSILIDVGETMNNGMFDVPIYSYSTFPGKRGWPLRMTCARIGMVEFTTLDVALEEKKNEIIVHNPRR